MRWAVFWKIRPLDNSLCGGGAGWVGGIKNKINRLLPPCMADILDLCVRKTLLDFVGLLYY